MTRARPIVLGVAGVVLIGGAGLASAGLGGRTPKAAARSTLPPATAAIVRTTLVETQDVDGTLGYGDTGTATGGGGHGTLTWLPAPGTVLARGRSAYNVDDHPVPLLYGTLPLYRTLSTGTQGRDALEFERNLAALGYSGFTVDKTYTSATATAVRRWQKKLGVEQTGTVTPGSVLLAPGEIRVAERKAQAGGQPSGPLFTFTGTTRVVSVDLDVEDQALARTGAKTSIDLPDGGTTTGTITRIGKVATAGEGDSPTTVKITITLREQGILKSYDKAPVTVHLLSSKHPDVLAVPIEALLARSGGGYAVQVVTGAAVRTVPVDTGVFTQGKVEISGSGLVAGMKVGVPS